MAMRQWRRDTYDAWYAKLTPEAKAERTKAASRRYAERTRQARIDALADYGGKCAECGEDDQRVLCIDHIDGNGSQHRKSISGTVASDLKRRGWPDGFQLLCANCNMRKEYERRHNGS